MFKDKKLKAIKFADAETGEILGMISKDCEALCKKDYVIILDYSKEEEKTITEIDGKFYELSFVEKQKEE